VKIAAHTSPRLTATKDVTFSRHFEALVLVEQQSLKNNESQGSTYK
jgi:hypothetical protein